MPQIFEATDPDVASEIFRQQYTAMRMRVQGSQPLLRLASTPVGRARLDRATFLMELDGYADPLETVGVLYVRTGTVRCSCDGVETTYGPGDTGFPVPLGRRWATHLHDVDSELVMLDPALLAETAGTEPEAGAPVRLLSNRPRSEPAAAQLWRTAEAVRTLTTSQADGEPYPLLVSSAARLLAASVLAAFPSTAFPEPTIEDRHDAHRAALRRAISFIDENATADITINDIAAAAFVTPRAVQLAFRRHLGITPMEYLRRVRLEHAHRDLLAADPAHETVTTIAYRWGFASPGRFSAYYRAAYGIPPSRTLRHD
ncbi:MAG: helix-turn-helix transcriptional regulator [Actinobacteria bacterium]|nr:helix-turn-helix transcriptional regulator [Actinomycetota bacterium]